MNVFFLILLDGSGGLTQTPYRKSFGTSYYLQIDRKIYRGVRSDEHRPDRASVFYNMRKQKLSVFLDFKKANRGD